MHDDGSDWARTFLKAVKALRPWKRSGERAPHKPLLLLWALGRVQQGESRLVEFSDAEAPLRKLLTAYGPPRRSLHPEYPFWRLQTDHIWEVVGADGARSRASNTDPPVSELRRHHVRGGFPQPLAEVLAARPALVRRAARELLDRHFPESFHAELLAETNLEVAASARPTSRSRDPRFRDEVMQAYGYRCAVCGFDGALDGHAAALDAAHIRWHCYEGPSIVANGLCLCPLHHRALDLGAIGITPERRIAVSARVHGGDVVQELLLRYHGEPLRKPQPRYLPAGFEFVSWHTERVFRAPSR